MKTPSRRLVEHLKQAEPWLPAVLLGTSAFWTGTFQAPMWPESVLLGHLLLAGCVMVVPARWNDPLGLGPRGRWLETAFLGWLVLGVLLSPVRRAGWMVLMTYPMWLFLPSVVARCWDSPRRRRRGLLAVALVLTAVASWGLWTGAQGSNDRIALPLGHHNLMALWCLALLPLVTPLVAARHLGHRGLGASAILLAASTVLLTQSLAGGVGLLLWLVWTVFWSRGLRGSRWIRLRWVRSVHLLAPWVAILGAVTWHGPRLAAVFQGQDLSWGARLAYWQGAWHGVLERPWGWGAGSTAWTLAEHLPIRPGMLVPGQAVADAHSLPLGWLYELGWPGLLLLGAMLGRLLWQLRRSGPGSYRRAPAAAALAMILVTSLAGAPMAVLALTTAWLVVLGSGRTVPARRPTRRWGYVVLITALLIQVVRMDWAAISYSQAQTLDTSEAQRRALSRARALDPGVPLYGAHLGQMGLDDPFSRDRAQRQLRQAAEKAYAVPSLWLWSGFAGAPDGEDHPMEPLLQACRLDPLGAMAPYLLATTWPEDPRASAWSARALMAEPRLLAARPWLEAPQELAEAVSLLERDESIDRGWRARLFESHQWLLGADTQQRDWQRLVLSMDGEPSTSVSLHTFRRRPWPMPLVTVEVDAAVLVDLDLISLSGVRSETPSRLWSQGCESVHP